MQCDGRNDNAADTPFAHVLCGVANERIIWTHQLHRRCGWTAASERIIWTRRLLLQFAQKAINFGNSCSLPRRRCDPINPKVIRGAHASKVGRSVLLGDLPLAAISIGIN